MKLNIKQNKIVRDKYYFRIIIKQIKHFLKYGNDNDVLNLFGEPIKKLPSFVKVINGDLNIDFTKITELPRGLVINGDLYMINTNISELPDDIIINGNLYCYKTPLNEKYSIKELKDKYKITGEIYGAKY